MSFRQDELITTGYFLYTVGIMIILLLVVYFALRYFRAQLTQRFSDNSLNSRNVKTVKLSSKTVLYIVEHGTYDLIVVESGQQASVLHLNKNETNRSSANEVDFEK
jgi:flagellar biogenesis protein FliO